MRLEVEPRRPGAAMQLLPLLAWALLPGCWAVTGPDEVRGFLRGSLRVTCKYRPGREMQPKFWCVPGTLFTCDEDIVITSRQQPVVRQGRFSIRDNRESREITVIVHNLTKGDSGTHLCGVRTGKASVDLSHSVEVIVSPAPLPSSPASPYASTTKHAHLTSSVSVPTQITPRGKAVQPGPNHSYHDGSNPARLNVVEHILIPGIVVVLLLLLIAVGVLVMLSRKRKKALLGAAMEMDRTRSTSQAGADALNYSVINHSTRTAGNQLYSNAEALRSLKNTTTEYMEVRHSYQCLEDEKETLYARVQKPRPEQKEIYANLPSAREEPYSTGQGV
ncbi:CMRF35-like molecule 6 [Apus apus]|uniref:CMRF35-like molecule 6 n=1 Tax=Apus apus TaxID=8895 RepID=UPI0021F8B525|nr:CMRF35-like molecule 6 [Apus apus]